jgi:pimeloyl-ACP methyl ester carboxylesterase
VRGLVSIVALALAWGCRAEPQPEAQAKPDPVLEPAPARVLPSEFECGEDLPERARCGLVEVFEDREARSGRTIALNVVVLPAREAKPGPVDPVFVLAGGPGQAATRLVAGVDWLLGDVSETRDLVFVDQRGTGSSNGLQCVPERFPDLLHGVLDERLRASLDACREGYDADLARYTTTVATADLDEVRAALGYETINLWGVSYGTRAALEYLRRHGEHVRSVILWGVARPGVSFVPEFTAASELALAELFIACADAPACAARLPEGAAHLERLLARLDAEPVELDLRDPRDDSFHRIEAERSLVLSAVSVALYGMDSAARLPAMIHAAELGDFAPLLEFYADYVVGVAREISIGMYLSVVCSEDVALIEPEHFEVARASSLFGAALLTELVDACHSWPRAELPADWREPIHSSVPVLVMNGELDPATPARAARAAVEGLDNAALVIFPNVGHGFSGVRDCMAALVEQFVADPRPDQLERACVSSIVRPPFVLE